MRNKRIHTSTLSVKEMRFIFFSSDIGDSYCLKSIYYTCDIRDNERKWCL